MAESYFPMLPKIDVKVNRILLDQAGVWKSGNLNFLQGLASSLATGETLEDVGNIDSIPDIWAKPLLFKMALFDLETTREFVAGLHDRVLGEWRALLAMFALKNVKQLNLKALSVDLTEENLPLAKVLKALAPKESLLGNDKAWLTDIYVIYYNDYPIAITSPTTLVATAADYMETFRGQLGTPWSKDKTTLSDPIKNLTHDELLALKEWLKKLYIDLQSIGRSLNANSQDIAINLLKCVESYREDVSRELGGNATSTVNFVASNLNLHMGLARLLNETVQGREASIDDSAVRLLNNPSRMNKKLLLVSADMIKTFARQEGVEPARLVVWQGVSGNDVTQESLRGERNTINGIILKGAEFRRPEDFFYEQMAVVEPGNAFPGSMEISGTIVLANDGLTPILPIKRELLEIFTPQEIVNRLSISEDGDNIFLNFNFPLSGTNGTGTDLRFTKQYSKRDLIYIQQEVPVIELWPNIRRDGWDKYYLYYENYQAQATGRGASDVLVDEMYYVEPWTYGQKLDENFPVQGLKNRFTAKLNSFPEALICNYKLPNSGATAQTIGLILIDTPEVTQRQPGLNWRVGVDFGTSSTMLYFGTDKKQPAPLDFEPRLFKVTESGSARFQTFRNFIASVPSARPDGSFLSIFHLLNLNEGDSEIRPLQDGHILSFIRRDIFEEFGHRVDMNLKWKDDPVGRRKVAAYIHQICMQVLVEATVRGVDKIQWNFSYPTAFSAIQKASFDTTCRKTLQDVYKGSGFKINVNQEVEIWSESEASAWYFNKLNNTRGVNFTNSAICIDIGAGTTDISIISGQPAEIIYHTSIQYAGRYMFKSIYDHYELFFIPDPNVRDSEKYKTLDDIKAVSDIEQRDALVDADMRLHSEMYLEDLPNKNGQESVKDVLQGAQFAVAGLFYYLGKLLQALREGGHYVDNNLPDIFVGGNGSRIFNWLTGGTVVKDNPYLDVLAKMLRDASGLSRKGKFRLNFSEYPKVEVATGMIIATQMKSGSQFFDEQKINRALFHDKAKDPYICNSVLAGAEFIDNDKQTEPLSFISAHDMSNGLRVESMNEFKNFITCFNNAPNLWADGIPFDDDTAEELIRQTNSFYISLHGKDLKKIFVEPVFIVEMKYLLEMFNYE